MWIRAFSEEIALISRRADKMGWTEERVEILKKLWLDGLSASQIAKQLGGVTRNAVIGKVHRLGLSGRAAPSQPARPALKTPRPQRPAATVQSATPQTPAQPQIRRPVAVTAEAHTPVPAPRPISYAEEPGSATVLTLGAHMCKWPIGDPSTDGFTFCGRRGTDGPYCAEHARVAYAVPVGKKKQSPNELARSLRRYI
jgi:GcrA cell cycle regulator